VWWPARARSTIDLLEARRERTITDIAIIRVEQLYPFPAEELTQQFRSFPAAREVVWCQEEPQNQGAWLSIQDALRSCLRDDQELHYAGRKPMASPAGGDYHKHLERQKLLNRNWSRPTPRPLPPEEPTDAFC
jgi:2-oxoglutarate dehydrogenase E1 component